MTQATTKLETIAAHMLKYLIDISTLSKKPGLREAMVLPSAISLFSCSPKKSNKEEDEEA
jgi:hypothetical protein